MSPRLFGKWVPAGVAVPGEVLGMVGGFWVVREPRPCAPCSQQLSWKPTAT